VAILWFSGLFFTEIVLKELFIMLNISIIPLRTVPVPVMILITSFAMSVPAMPGSTPKRPDSAGVGLR
jgi:hypothetical protein